MQLKGGEQRGLPLAGSAIFAGVSRDHAEKRRAAREGSSLWSLSAPQAERTTTKTSLAIPRLRFQVFML